jgi:4-hydroxy-2-oxoheptanedioate aldolase
MRANRVKQELQAGRASIGTWLSLGSIVASRFLARAGFAWLTVDVEHSLVSWETTCHMLGSIADAGCVGLVRVPSNRHDHIKRALDNGAMGIVVPMVNSREEAEAAIAAAKYPPRGTRSIGGSVHALNFATDAATYYRHADEQLLVVLQCEHIRAVERADDIFSVPGIDVIFVGPNDLAWSLRQASGGHPSAEEMEQVLGRIYQACRRHGVAPGIHCLSLAEAQMRLEQGWQFLAVTSELKMLLDGAAQVVSTLLGHSAASAASY